MAFDRDGEIVGDTVEQQARQVWQNIADVLEAAGSSVADVVKVTYIMQDIREIAESSPSARKCSPGGLPGRDRHAGRRTCLPGLKMEVDVIAVMSRD